MPASKDEIACKPYRSPHVIDPAIPPRQVLHTGYAGAPWPFVELKGLPQIVRRLLETLRE